MNKSELIANITSDMLTLKAALAVCEDRKFFFQDWESNKQAMKGLRTLVNECRIEIKQLTNS